MVIPEGWTIEYRHGPRRYQEWGSEGGWEYRVLDASGQAVRYPRIDYIFDKPSVVNDFYTLDHGGYRTKRRARRAAMKMIRYVLEQMAFANKVNSGTGWEA